MELTSKLGNSKKKVVVAYLFLMPAIIGFIVFKYFPILAGFFASAFKVSVVNFPGEFVGWDNYIRLWRDKQFWESLWINIEFYLYGLAFSFWPPILGAFLINEMGKGKTFWRVAYFIPCVGTVASGAVLWRFIWNPDFGLANYLMRTMGASEQMWLNDPALVKFCMSFPGLFALGGMNMLIYLAAFQDIPESQVEAALLDGCGLFKRFRYIAWPTIKPIVGTMFLLNFINSFNQYETQMLMTGGGPMGKTTTTILHAYKIATTYSDYGYAITVSTAVFAFVFTLTALKMWWDGRREED